jgi:hypothetical protein
MHSFCASELPIKLELRFRDDHYRGFQVPHSDFPEFPASAALLNTESNVTIGSIRIALKFLMSVGEIQQWAGMDDSNMTQFEANSVRLDSTGKRITVPKVGCVT